MEAQSVEAQSVEAPLVEAHSVDAQPVDMHRAPDSTSDRIALAFVKTLRFVADTFFARRYGHRAVVLETVAAVPGMVAGLLQHLRGLREMRDDRAWCASCWTKPRTSACT